MTDHDPTTAEEGWEVCGVDGQRVGTVKSSADGALIVTTGQLTKTDLHVPISYIEGIVPERVTLSVPSDSIESMGWDRPLEEQRTMTDETGPDAAPGSARIGTSEPDTREPVAPSEQVDPDWVEEAADTGSRDRAGSTSVAAEATEPTGGQTAPVARPADAMREDRGGADTTTMTGAGYGAGMGASSAGGLGARSGPDAQEDRAGGSGRGGTSDLAPPAEDQERPTTS